MSEVIVVTSGKGGVGKTTTSANIAAGLALRGKKVAVIDFDVGLRNLDLVMGCERRVVYDFVNVINGEATLNQALIRDKHAQNLYILPASQTRDKEALTEAGVEKVIRDLKTMGFDYIVCDSPAGIEHGALMALTFADHAIVVVNPEVSSVRDSDRIIGILQSRSRRAREGREPVQERLLITRYSPRRVRAGEMLSYLDILEILKVPLLGVIPESQRVLESSNAGVPAVHDTQSEVAQAYGDAIDRFLGKQVPLRFVAEEDKGFLRRLIDTASVAKERLQVIIAREGARNSNPELLHQIKQAVLEAVSKFVPVKPEDIAVDLDSDREMEVLSVSVSLPDGKRIKA